MTHRATITLDADVYAFLEQTAGKNRSAYINALLQKERDSLLAEAMLKANMEESEDADYQAELRLWDVASEDGLRS